jgi:hypothetical protein
VVIAFTLLWVVVIFLLIRSVIHRRKIEELEKKRREDWEHFSCLLVGIERDIIDMQDWIKRRIHNDAERN